MPLISHGPKTRSLLHFACQAVFCAGMASTVLSAGYPDFFTVYALHGTQSLEANCKKVDESNIQCEFIQVLISRPTTHEKLQERHLCT